VRAKGAAWMTTGACMIALGGGSLAVAIWSYNTVGFLGTDAKVNRDGVVSLFDRANDSFVVGLPWIIGIGGLIGMIVAAVGLIRARTVPLWEPILLIIGPVVAFVGGDGILGAILSLPLVIALIALAYESLLLVRQRARAESMTGAGTIDLTQATGSGMPAQRGMTEQDQPRPQASL